jgi:hypothetical protein
VSLTKWIERMSWALIVFGVAMTTYGVVRFNYPTKHASQNPESVSLETSTHAAVEVLANAEPPNKPLREKSPTNEPVVVLKTPTQTEHLISSRAVAAKTKVIENGPLHVEKFEVAHVMSMTQDVAVVALFLPDGSTSTKLLRVGDHLDSYGKVRSIRLGDGVVVTDKKRISVPR